MFILFYYAIYFMFVFLSTIMALLRRNLRVSILLDGTMSILYRPLIQGTSNIQAVQPIRSSLEHSVKLCLRAFLTSLKWL